MSGTSKNAAIPEKIQYVGGNEEAAAAMAMPPNPRRLLVHGFLAEDICKELEFIHRSCSVAGYRPGVLSTTLSHLIATNCGHLVLPFIPIRDRIKELVEDFFGCPFTLFIEFTGLISWCRGSYIGWHSDDNRPYLKQRDFAAVCYLNSHGKDFRGGVFHFQDGDPVSVFPVSGDVLIYTADSYNVHCVDEVTQGERLTLTFWLTRDCVYNEDPKIINLLSQSLSANQDGKPESLLPLPASECMYRFPLGQLGFDVRYARVRMLGFDFCSCDGGKYGTSGSSNEPIELLSKPLRLSKGNVVLQREFMNSLHALQVVQFYRWKARELVSDARNIVPDAPALEGFFLKMNGLESTMQLDLVLVEEFLGSISDDEVDGGFNWEAFRLAVAQWEDYIYNLSKNLSSLLPSWASHNIILYVNPSEIEEAAATTHEDP